MYENIFFDHRSLLACTNPLCASQLAERSQGEQLDRLSFIDSKLQPGISFIDTKEHSWHPRRFIMPANGLGVRLRFLGYSPCVSEAVAGNGADEKAAKRARVTETIDSAMTEKCTCAADVEQLAVTQGGKPALVKQCELWGVSPIGSRLEMAARVLAVVPRKEE